MAGTGLGADEAYRLAAGAVVGRIRRERGWSLREFAEHAGVSHTALYAVERADNVPTPETLARIAAVAGLSLASLLALIVDELATAERDAPGGPGSLAALVGEAAPLDERQRAELRRFIGWLRYRDGEASGETAPPAR